MKKALSILLFLLIMLSLASCGFSVTTAKITDAVSCRSVDGAGKPVDETAVFGQGDTVMYAAAKAVNIPSGTKVTIVWKYSDGSETTDIDTVVLDLDDSRYINSNLTVDGGFPVGTYTAEFFVDDREEPDQTVTITVE